MAVNAYLNFPGTCEAAFKFYESALGAKIEALMPHAGTPMESHIPADWKNKIIHARINIQGTIVMASDAPPGHYQKPQGFSISLQSKTAAEAEQHFKALAEGGTTLMALQPTFWAERFGMCTDRFGIPWMINCEKSQPAAQPKKKFMTLWRPGKNATPPGEKMISEVTALVSEMLAQGVMLSNGGWDPNSPCTTVKNAGGKITVTDGPFAEAKEVISGFAMYQTATREEAIEWGKRFMAIAGEGSSELRELGGPDQC